MPAAPTFLADEARAFLARLATAPGHLLEIRSIQPDGPLCRRFFTTLDATLAFVGLNHGRANVYVGATPRCRREGKRDAVGVVIAVWADIDFHQIEEDRGDAEAIAFERLAAFHPQPTMVVHTGNGLQLWWLFDQPVVLDSEYCTAHRVEAVNRGLQLRLGGDAVWDLARVLRVPGTLNLPDKRKRARGCVPVMARLVDTDGPTHGIDDFRHLEVHEVQDVPRPERPPTPEVLAEPDLEVCRAFMELLERLGPDHPVVQTWRGERTIRDTSRSGWDWALARELSRLQVKETYVVEILRMYPLGRGAEGRVSYLQRTAKKARNGG